LEDFNRLLCEHRVLPKSFMEDAIMKLPSRDVMNLLSRGVLALYSFDEKADDISIDNVVMQCIKLCSQLPMIAVYGYQVLKHYFQNQSTVIHCSRPEYSIAENILHLFGPDINFWHLEAVVLDLAHVLHAEHGGGNNSTF